MDACQVKQQALAGVSANGTLTPAIQTEQPGKNRSMLA